MLALRGFTRNGPTVGAVAVDFLVGMIQRNDPGIPGLPHSILVEGTWQDGATLNDHSKGFQQAERISVGAGSAASAGEAATKTSNIQHRTSNAEPPALAALDIRRSVFDVSWEESPFHSVEFGPRCRFAEGTGVVARAGPVDGRSAQTRR